MKYLSIIIPTFNCEKTIQECLSAIKKSLYQDYELIVVDDGSKDHTVDIVKNFECKLILGDHHGRSAARNNGIEAATGDIVVFIDSDVVIKEDTLSQIHDLFSYNLDTDAVSGLLSINQPAKDFFTQYKNLYMNFIFNKVKNPIRFLYCSIAAIRKSKLEPFDDNMRYAIDTDLGQRLAAKGCKIILDRSLDVVHLKKYNFISLMKNDFNVSCSWTIQFLKYKGYREVFKNKRFAHASLSQIAGIAFSPFLIFFLLLLPIIKLASVIFIILILLFLLVNYGLLGFFRQKKGNLFFFKAISIVFIDYFIMWIGISVGFIAYFVTKER